MKRDYTLQDLLLLLEFRLADNIRKDQGEYTEVLKEVLKLL